MKALFLIQGYEHPASRYRVLQYLDCLRANGVEDRVAVFPKGRGEWRALEGELRDCEVVFVQKKRLKRREAKFIRRCGGARIVFDVDDAVMFKSSRARSHRSFKRMSAFTRMCGLSDFVIAGNAYLEGMARKRNSATTVIPTSINTDRYPVRTHTEGAEVCIGWIGGRKSLVFLEALAPVFERVYEKCPGARLKIVCSAFFDLPKMPVEKKPWSEDDEGADVASFDVGLAPLPDDPWSRGKCATKLLQCMAAGVPCVASAVGVHNEIVKRGENGFTARTDDEWFEALVRLCSEASLRAAMGAAAEKTVREQYSLAASGPKMLAVLRKFGEGLDAD